MKLSVWRRRRDLLDMLRIVSIERFLDPEARTDYENWNATWHRVTAQIVEWAHKAPSGGRRPLVFDELRDLVLEARLWRPMDGAINAVAARKVAVRRDGKRFILRMTSIPDLEFLDILLERGVSPTGPHPAPPGF